MAFVNPGGLQMVSRDIYPFSERGGLLREKRLVKELTLRKCAELLNIYPSTLSGLETGRFTLSDEDWQHVFTTLDSTPHQD